MPADPHDYPEPPVRPARRRARLPREADRPEASSHPRDLGKCPASGKARHAEWYAATRHVRRLIRAEGDCAGALAVYRCPDCHDWHVGHVRPPTAAQVVAAAAARAFWEALERPAGYW